MRYPNQRYGNPSELRFYAAGIPIRDLARQLRRDERTVSDWLKERQKIPFWVPELLRLRNMEREHQLRRMGIAVNARRFGIVAGDVIQFPERSERTVREQRPLTRCSSQPDDAQAVVAPRLNAL